jgi:hypothetical protein
MASFTHPHGGEPGHALGQFAWGHFLAVGKGGKIYMADVLNGRRTDLAVSSVRRPPAKWPNMCLPGECSGTEWQVQAGPLEQACQEIKILLRLRNFAKSSPF